MTPEQAKLLLLDFGWPEPERKRIREALHLAETLPGCREAMQDYDTIRGILSKERTHENLDSEASLERIAAGIRNFRRPWLARLVGPLSIAAALGIAFIGGWYARIVDRSAGSGSPSIDTMALRLIPSGEETQHYLSLFDELGSVYEHRTGWMLVSSGDTDLGFDSRTPAAATRSATPFVLRLGAIDDGILLASADLVIEPGQNAESVIPLGKNRSLRITVNAPEGSKIEPRIRVEVFDPENATLRADAVLASSVDLQPGQVRSAGRVNTAFGGLEIRVAAGSSL